MGQATAATAGFQTATGTAAGGVGGLAGTVGKFTPRLAAGGGLVYAMKETAGAAIEWESAFAGVRKTVDASESEFAALSDGLREMATEIPTTAGELAAIAESAGQLGIETDNIVEFTRVIADLGETTNLAGQEAATTLARFANITGMQQEKFENLGSALVRLGNNFETTEAEVASFGLRIAAAGDLAGMTEGDILGIGAAFSSVGVQAERGGTAVNKVVSSMIEAVATGNEDLQTFADTVGMTADQFAEAWRADPGQAFAQFVQGLGQAGDQAYQILDELDLKDERLVQSFLAVANAGDLMTESIQASNEGFEEANDLSEEAQQRYDTLAAKIDVLKNKWEEVSITIGDAVVPAVDKAVTALGFLAEFAHPDTMGEVRQAFAEGDVGPLSLDTARQWIGLEEPTADLDGLAGAAAGVTTQLSESDQAAMDAVGSFSTLGEGLDDTAGAYTDVAGAADDATAAMANSADEARKLADPVFALFDAWRDYEDAIVAADEAIAQHGATSHEAVQAGQDLYLALLDLQEAAANGEVSFEAFERELGRAVEMGRITEEQAHAIAHGIDHARESANEYAGDYTAQFHAETDEAISNVAELLAALEGLPRERRIAITTDYGTRAREQVIGGSGTAPAGGSVTSGGGTTYTRPPGGSGGVQERAAGGSVWPGQDFLVGERGPEVLRLGPGGFGSITPTTAPPIDARGGGGTSIGRQMLVQDGAVQQNFYGHDSRQAGAEASWELRKLAYELGG